MAEPVNVERLIEDAAAVRLDLAMALSAPPSGEALLSLLARAGNSSSKLANALALAAPLLEAGYAYREAIPDEYTQEGLEVIAACTARLCDIAEALPPRDGGQAVG